MPVHVIQARVTHLWTKIRDRETPPHIFRLYARRLMRVIAEEGLSYINPVPVTVRTPVEECTYDGIVNDLPSIVVVSIIRAGDSLLDVVMELVPECAVGKILIQRNEETAEAELFYSKLPPLADKNIILVDPMLATGGSAIVAIRILLEKPGVTQKNITFLNVVSCPEGLKSISDAYPEVTIITGSIDSGLNAKKWICPGLGDFGDRYFDSV